MVRTIDLTLHRFEIHIQYNTTTAEKEGIIDEYQKGLIKDLVINGNDKLNKAMDAYQRGDNTSLKELIKSGYLNKQQIHKLDLLGDEELDIGFLNVGRKGQAMVPKDAMFSLDDVSFTSGSGDPLTPGQSFMHVGNDSISLPSGIQYSPAMGAMHSPQPGLVLQYVVFDIVTQMTKVKTRDVDKNSNINRYSPHLQPIQSYHSPGMHGISSNMFGFPDEFTNFNFDVNRSQMSQNSPLLQPQQRTKATRKSRSKNGTRTRKNKRRSSSTSRNGTTKGSKKMKKGGGLGVKKMAGKYSPRSRRARIERFLRKRKERVWTKRVKYDVRDIL